jgi:hypothetical protein
MNKRGRYKLVAAMLILFCIGFITSYDVGAVTEQTYITVKVNDKCIKMDSLPYLKGDRTFVSIRFIAQALGAEIGWVGEKKMVVINDGYNYIELFIGSNEYYVNAEKRTMDVAPEISNGRTMVPLRFVSENLRCSVDWNEMAYSVLISKEGLEVPEEYVYNRSYTDEDLMWLARIVTVEARGATIEGKLAVANVVLNRVKSSVFPNNVHDVIFQSGQFPPAHKAGFKELVPPKDCIIAAKMALEGENNIGTCLYFNNRPFTSRSSKFYKKIDGEYFYN